MEDKLPLELWLEILSYLPRKFHRRLIAVNRALFEYALDDIYKEIQLVDDDEQTLFTFTRLQNEDVAKRVQRFVIRPTFLPNDTAVPFQFRKFKQPKCLEKAKNRFNWFTKSKKPTKSSSDILLSIAQRNIALCSNIRELDIIISLKNIQLTSSFESFFRSIWEPGSILPRIRKLTINATPYELSHLIWPMHPFSHLWTNLEHLDLTIRPYHETSSHYYTLLSTSTFLSGLKDGLLSFTLSGNMVPYVERFLMASPQFSRLLNFEIHSIFNTVNMKHVQPLTRFLETHSATLESIIIDPQIKRDVPGFSSNYSYIRWLTFEGTDHARNKTFSHITFPRLRDLELRYDRHWINGPLQYRPLFPNMNTVSPNLTTLSITRTELSLERISELLPLLPHRNGACSIKSLNLSIGLLSPELVDLLSVNLVDLRSLKLTLSWYVLRSDLEQYLFYKIIRQRRYPAWRLQDLCINSSSSCGTPHPNSLAMTTIAATLPNPPNLNTAYGCQCQLL